MQKTDSIKKADCYTCKHMGSIPGDAHKCCMYPGTTTGMYDFLSKENTKIRAKLNIKADPVGVRGGWFLWPINFDPVWLENCDGYEEVHPS